METTTYSLSELADAADVSARTVRYYISEGLLPPPEGHGLTSRYTEAHLERLRLIAEMKALYLPLREIRNRLGDPELPAVPSEAHSSRSDARDYLRTLRRATPSRASHEEDAGVVYSMPPPTASSTPASAPAMSPPEPYLSADELVEDLGPPGRTWRRIPLGDDAELVIADDLLRRRRDKVAWLVGWARRVLR